MQQVADAPPEAVADDSPAPVPAAQPPTSAPPPAPPKASIAAATPTAPQSGTLHYSGIPIPQNGEVVFVDLPNARLRFTFDHQAWQASIRRQPNGTQILTMHSLLPGQQTQCDVKWEIVQ